jgi:hypothetical protein
LLKAKIKKITKFAYLRFRIFGAERRRSGFNHIRQLNDRPNDVLGRDGQLFLTRCSTRYQSFCVFDQSLGGFTDRFSVIRECLKQEIVIF